MMDQGKKYLSDIYKAAELIEDFISTLDNYEQYVSDIKTQSAVERQLAIIGEAINKYEKSDPDNTLNNAHRIIGLRNRLIHAYDAIDPSIIWAIIKKHLPNLKSEVGNLLTK